MNPPAGKAHGAAQRGVTALFAAALAVVAGAAYWNTRSVPFLFDDEGSIVDNPTLRDLGRLGRVLHPPAAGGLTVGGRPILNLSLAVNYAISGSGVWSYHALNFLIHVSAGLALFGILRRTLAGLAWERPQWFAFGVALLWTVHPLQTESVTYVIQRAESLMGLFYLLTLYCFIRGAEAESPSFWFGCSWAACLLGMGTKEVMVSAPVMVFLYDRTFVAGTFAEAWRGRWKYYLALGSTWLLLAWLVLGAGGDRGGSAGFGLGIPWGAYLLTQGPAILHYLRLAAWPHPLVFYYTARWVHGALAWSECAVVALLVVATVWALARRAALGFLGAWFFGILAPTSIVPGPAETLAEHRMYLPLAAVLMLLAAAWRLGARKLGSPPFWAGAAAALALAFCVLTALRNRLYRSEWVLWADTVAKAPDNPYAQNNLGVALDAAGRTAEAIGHYSLALRLKPDFADALSNRGNALRTEGRTEEAIADFTRAIRIVPGDAAAYNGLGNALTDLRRWPQALAAFDEALRLRPQYAEACYNLGIALAEEGRLPDAIGRFEEAVRLAPALLKARLNLGTAYALTGRYREAEAQFEAALRIRPDYAPARKDLALLREQEASAAPSP